jgi:hypothetical protein
MKLLNVIFSLLVIIIVEACGSRPKPITPTPKIDTTYLVDDNYILMSDVFLLAQGMPYSRVSEILKVPPYEIYSNVEDNCIIIKYLGKRALRIHDDKINNVPPPLVYYQSNETKKLTYGESFELHVILDGNQKNLRSYFTTTDASKITQMHALMKRAKLVCSSPEKTKNLLQEWFGTKPKKILGGQYKSEGSNESNQVSSGSGASLERESLIILRQSQIYPIVKIANSYKSGKISKDKAFELYARKFGLNPNQVLEFKKNQFRLEDLLATNRLVN